MNKSVTLTYTISQLPLDVKFADKVISIDFTPYVKKEELTFRYNEYEELVQKIKNSYYNIYQKQLKITDRSFMAEIWGHLVAYRAALWLQRNIRIWPVKKLAKFIAFRSGVIDCGEGKVDTNRWIWDILGWMFFKK